MGSHIAYNYWYIQSHMLADIKRRKSQTNKLKIYNTLRKVLKMKYSVGVLYGDMVV